MRAVTMYQLGDKEERIARDVFVPLFDLASDSENSETVRSWILGTVGFAYSEQKLERAIQAFCEVYQALEEQSTVEYWTQLSKTFAKWSEGFSHMRQKEFVKMRELLESIADGTVPSKLRVQILTVLGNEDVIADELAKEEKRMARHG